MPRTFQPCPTCGREPSHGAGRVLYPADGAQHGYAFDVCWDHNLARRRGSTGTWGPIKQARQQPQWIRHSPYHWQLQVNGELLDYWPTKRKMRWRGATRTGVSEDAAVDLARRMGERLDE